MKTTTERVAELVEREPEFIFVGGVDEVLDECLEDIAQHAEDFPVMGEIDDCDTVMDCFDRFAAYVRRHKKAQ